MVRVRVRVKVGIRITDKVRVRQLLILLLLPYYRCLLSNFILACILEFVLVCDFSVTYVTTYAVQCILGSEQDPGFSTLPLFYFKSKYRIVTFLLQFKFSIFTGSFWS